MEPPGADFGSSGTHAWSKDAADLVLDGEGLAGRLVSEEGQHFRAGPHERQALLRQTPRQGLKVPRRHRKVLRSKAGGKNRCGERESNCVRLSALLGFSSLTCNLEMSATHGAQRSCTLLLHLVLGEEAVPGVHVLRSRLLGNRNNGLDIEVPMLSCHCNSMQLEKCMRKPSIYYDNNKWRLFHSRSKRC